MKCKSRVNVWTGEEGCRIVQVAAGGSFPCLSQISTGFRMTPSIFFCHHRDSFNDGVLFDDV